MTSHHRSRRERLQWHLIGAVSCHDLSGTYLRTHLRRVGDNADRARQIRAIRRGQNTAFTAAIFALAITVAGVTMQGSSAWVAIAVSYFVTIITAALVVERHHRRSHPAPAR